MAAPADRIIDSDFCGQYVDFSVLTSYLSPDWRGYLRLDEHGRSLPGTRVALPESVYWNREYDEWRPLVEEDGAGDADPLSAARRYFEKTNVAFAVFNPGTSGGLSATGNANYANAIGRAVNDWQIHEWIERDDRVLGSIAITLKDPAQAAAEIRRVGGHERMVQVIVGHPPRLLGDRALDPVWEAAVEHGLPINLEARGAITGMNPALVTMGAPQSRFEYEASWIYGAQAHLLSMIAGGAFDRFPELRLILNGFGVAWLPSVIWRLELEQRTTPGPHLSPLNGLPEDYVRQHVRITSSRLDLPDKGERMIELLSLFGGSELLMLGSGPRAGVSEMERLRTVLPSDWQAGVLYENAAQIFQPASRASTLPSRA
jgi:uncharacterized protein